MKVVTVTLKSLSAYSQSRAHNIEREREEAYDHFEERTWRDRLHTDADGNVVIPPMAIKIALSESARFLSKKIPGKRNATYTKHFESGILVMDPMPLGIHRDAVEGEWLFLNPDGKRGGNGRVWKKYPVIPAWEGTTKVYVLDSIINQEVFSETLREAGSFIGLGRFRPSNNGYYGRFQVTNIKWEDVDAGS